VLEPQARNFIIQEGNYFGEVTFFLNRQITASIRSQTVVQLLTISRKDFSEILLSYPTKREKILKNLTTTSKHLLDRVGVSVETAEKDFIGGETDSRLAAEELKLAEGAGESDPAAAASGSSSGAASGGGAARGEQGASKQAPKRPGTVGASAPAPAAAAAAAASAGAAAGAAAGPVGMFGEDAATLAARKAKRQARQRARAEREAAEAKQADGSG